MGLLDPHGLGLEIDPCCDESGLNICKFLSICELNSVVPICHIWDFTVTFFLSVYFVFISDRMHFIFHSHKQVCDNT